MDEEKYEHCKRKFLWKSQYYKSILKTVLSSCGIAAVIILAIVGYSYGPVSDIAALKVEVKNIHKKLDILIKNGKVKEKPIEGPQLTLLSRAPVSPLKP